MNCRTLSSISAKRSANGGSVLIIVLWIAFGLVSVALYFGNSMSLQLRASDNRYAAIEAQQALEGGERYVGYVLSNMTVKGVLPDPSTYISEAAPVGNGYFWLIGRSTNEMTSMDAPYYGLIDEASRLNLNTATIEMLTNLPGMTPQLAAAIIDWRDSDENITENGAESETYSARIPSYRSKNAKFETTDELRLVAGADLDIIFGEDWNRNGVLDMNENDGETSPPSDNRDGRLDFGILEYLTVYSREGILRDDGSGTNKVNVTTANANQLREALTEKLGEDRARQIEQRFTAAGQQPAQSMLEFYIRSQMTAEEFAQVEPNLYASATDNTAPEGLININTASTAVLGCIPGIGLDKAATVAAYRQSNPESLTTVAWLVQALDQASALQAGPYVTTHSYQFTADIAAVGHFGRGYQRAKFVFDTSSGSPRVVFRQDLSHLGWALGPTTRNLLLTQSTGLAAYR